MKNSRKLNINKDILESLEQEFKIVRNQESMRKKMRSLHQRRKSVNQSICYLVNHHQKDNNFNMKNKEEEKINSPKFVTQLHKQKLNNKKLSNSL